jgi:hypothetical protein
LPDLTKTIKKLTPKPKNKGLITNMSQIPQVASTQGSPSFDPDAFFEAWAQETLTPPYDNDFRKFIIKAFGLKPNDDFVYRAIAEVTLLQAQTYLEFGGQGGLHGWYLDEEGKEVSSFFELFSSFPLRL